MAKKKELKLNLGCGHPDWKKQDNLAGYIGIDIAKSVKPDIVHDLTKYPWPFKNNSVDEIFCSHFLEHLDGNERIKFFNECYRIMKAPYEKDGVEVKAIMTVITPAPFTHRYMQDPTHKFPMIVQEFYNYLNQDWLKAVGIEHYSEFIKCNFDWSGFFQENGEAVGGRSDEYKSFAAKYYINSLIDLCVKLTKK